MELEEDELRRHIGLLLEAQRVARLGSWHWDVESDTVTWSDEHYRIFGLDRDGCTPSYATLLRFFHEDDLPFVESVVERALLTGEPLSYVARIRRPDGEVRWIEANAAPATADGRVVGMVGTVRDVTDRHVTEEALRQSEQRFRALVQHATDLVLVLGGDGIITYVSPSLQRLTGYAVDDLVGRDGATLVHPDDLGLTLGCFQRIAVPGSSVTAEYRVKTVEGGWRRVETVFTNLLHEPAVGGFVLNSRDVTQRAEAEASVKASEERYRLMVETAEEGVWLLDASGVTTFANQRAAAILRCSVDALLGRSVFEFIPDAERTQAAEAFERGRQGVSEQLELRLVRADGTELWAQLSASPIVDGEGRYAGALAMMTDITARRRDQDELCRSKRQLTAAQRLSRTGSWDRDLRTDSVRWSDMMFELLGVSPDAEPSISTVLVACHPEDRDRVNAVYERALADGLAAGQIRVLHPDGSERTLQCSIEVGRDADGVPARVTGTIQDITERKELEERLSRQSLHDALTDLPNRLLFVDRVEQGLRRSARTSEPVSVLFVDLDDFKTVNDSLGHTAGDEILVEVGRRLVAVLRPHDTVARLGGDEFAILLEGGAQPAAEEVADRVLGLFTRPLTVGGHDVVVHASVGIAVASKGTTAEDLLRDADSAMNAAKRQVGHARYRVFDDSLHAAARRRLELREQLQKAVERDEFEVYYQPIVGLGSGVVAGLEALVRWNHPAHGLVAPGRFIPLAEESGLIVAIGETVLRKAAAFTRALNGDRHDRELYVSVNLSASQLVQRDFLEMVDDVLGESGLRARHLVLEITESVLVADADHVVPVLHALRAKGIKVAADDFGTGYSSLSYLRTLPLDVLKIDRAFVTNIAESGEDYAVAGTVVRLADALGQVTVGEGIETREQAAALLEVGCAFGQGYLFSPPLPSRCIAEALGCSPALSAMGAASPVDGPPGTSGA